MRELHQQLVSCMNHFVEELRKYREAKAAEINSRRDTLCREIADAQQIIRDIELMLQSNESLAVGGSQMRSRCIDFFRSCVDVHRCEDDLSYLEFVQAGRLYVRSEHLGYLRLCDAVPEDVELRTTTSDRAVCNRQFAVVIATNRRDCVNAEPYLDVHLTDAVGSPVPVTMMNTNDGSYRVVFTPVRAGVHRLHVQLFGVTLDSSPMEIPVMSEAVMPNQSNSVPLNDRSGGAYSQHESSISINTLDSPVPNFVVRVPESFDSDGYFAAVASQCLYSPASSLPGSASKGSRSMPVRQVERDPQDHGDFEEVRRSMRRMTVDPVSPGDNRGDGGPSSVDRTQLDGPAPSQCSVHSYTNGEFVEFEDLTYEDFEGFDSTGLFYFIISAVRQ